MIGSDEHGSEGRLRVDAEDLIIAMQSSRGEADFYFDLTTGGIMMSLDGTVGEDDRDIDEVLDGEPDRYKYIEGISSSRAFRVMEQFVEDQAPLDAKQLLWRALEGPKPFRRFKDAADELGPVRDQWFAFEQKAYIRFAEQWLSEEGIDADLVVRVPKP